jgi:hypothetical protein
VLFCGILGALVFRGIFIALGSVLMQIHWIVVLFGSTYGEDASLSRASHLWPLVIAAISMVMFPLASAGAWCGRRLSRLPR